MSFNFDKATGCFLGLATGDAVGTTVEFKPRGTFAPMTDMVGGGPFNLPVGGWTDDTSMALALAKSLLFEDDLDEHDLMTRFVGWWRRGEESHTGDCFDIGGTTSAALGRFEKSGNPISGDTSPTVAGNGSIMRLAPVAIWGLKHGEEKMRDVARRQSATTHAAPLCLDACESLAVMLRRLMIGESFEAAARAAADTCASTGAIYDMATAEVGKQRTEARIQSSGFVRHTLDAALYCVATTDNFRDAILKAANLGNDADTTAAVAGQIAGALYGRSGIPAQWLDKLIWRDEFIVLAGHLVTGG